MFICSVFFRKLLAKKKLEEEAEARSFKIDVFFPPKGAIEEALSLHTSRYGFA